MERTTDIVAHSPARAGPRVEGPPRTYWTGG